VLEGRLLQRTYRAYPIESWPTAWILTQIKCLKTSIIFLCGLVSAATHYCVNTYQRLRDSHKPGHLKLILTEIQNFQRSVALQHLGNVSDPGLQRFNGYSSSVTHSRLTRISLPLRSRVRRAPSRGRASSALTLSSNAALGPWSCSPWGPEDDIECRVVTPP
jgi:hypothetical protein